MRNVILGVLLSVNFLATVVNAQVITDLPIHCSVGDQIAISGTYDVQLTDHSGSGTLTPHLRRFKIAEILNAGESLRSKVAFTVESRIGDLGSVTVRVAGPSSYLLYIDLMSRFQDHPTAKKTSLVAAGLLTASNVHYPIVCHSKD